MKNKKNKKLKEKKNDDENKIKNLITITIMTIK